MKTNSIIFVLLLIIFELCVSFYIRINFWPFYQHFGFYQGDIWYFFSYYGQQIQNDFFFPIEYPVGYVIIQKAAFLISRFLFQNVTYETFMLSHTLFIIPAGITIILAINKICQFIKTNVKSAFLGVVISPSMIIYSTINYDIFTVALIFLAILTTLKQKYFLSFFFLGLGTLIKIYPAFLIPAFILLMLDRKVKFSTIAVSVFISVLTFISINLPYYIYNSDFWFFPYKYQAMINPGRDNANTFSYYFSNILGIQNLQNLLLPIILLIAWSISYLFYKQSRLTNKNFVFLCFFICFSAVFGNIIYSPQYILWFLPFVALFQFPSAAFWIPFDFLNTAHIFFFFRIKDDFPFILHSIWSITVLFYLGLYILLCYRLYKISFHEKLKN